MSRVASGISRYRHPYVDVFVGSIIDASTNNKFMNQRPEYLQAMHHCYCIVNITPTSACDPHLLTSLVYFSEVIFLRKGGVAVIGGHRSFNSRIKHVSINYMSEYEYISIKYVVIAVVYILLS